jgi:allophanate hydrolase subunit 2
MDRLPATLRPSRHNAVRVVTREHPELLLDAEWHISPACDRTGYRLTGTAVLFGASITSEPVCPGVIQLPPSGEPIVLMADAPTVGGYRILGTVISTDLSALAQMTQDSTVSFESIGIEAAQRLAVENAERIQSVREWALA